MTFVPEKSAAFEQVKLALPKYGMGKPAPVPTEPWPQRHRA